MPSNTSDRLVVVDVSRLPPAAKRCATKMVSLLNTPLAGFRGGITPVTGSGTVPGTARRLTSGKAACHGWAGLPGSILTSPGTGA